MIMATGGSPVERVPVRPWAPLQGEDDPYDPEGRDEETIPLLDPGTDTLDLDGSNPFTKGL